MSLLERAVAEKGEDYIYDRYEMGSCAYFVGGKPACIVGHVFHYKGMTAEQFKRLADEDGYPNTARVRVLAETGLIDTDDSTLRLLDLVQLAQDDGNTWGVSLAEALSA